jgi:hypothetical protein
MFIIYWSTGTIRYFSRSLYSSRRRKRRSTGTRNRRRKVVVAQYLYW